MRKDLQVRESSLPIGSLEAYIYWANQIPMLDASEESALAIKFQENGDLEAARKLVLSHLRFVISVTRNYLGYGLSHADLIQEGTIGLMKAVKRFNPKMGVRLVTFAVHWIKSEIHEFIIRNWKIVKIATTKAQRKLFFNLRRATQKLGWFSDAEVQAIAKDLKVNQKEVRTMESRMFGSDVPFETLNDDDSDEENYDPANFLESSDLDPALAFENINWNEKRENSLHEALETLDERSREILRDRWLAENKKTLHELAAKYQISAERVRQLELTALKKLKESLESIN